MLGAPAQELLWHVFACGDNHEASFCRDSFFAATVNNMREGPPAAL